MGFYEMVNIYTRMKNGGGLLYMGQVKWENWLLMFWKRKK